MSIHRTAAQILELPEKMNYTPSRHNPWRSPKAAGARFTWHQLRVMKEAAVDPDTVDTVRVYDKVTSREMWWPTTEQAPVYAMSCPVLEIRPNGWRLVIAPAGDRVVVHESGRLDRGWGGPGIAWRKARRPR
ncbi:hypothetical protein [Rhizorhabdus sp.]|uniref:hypothetical protein n=1 Tax=Rhizorhabdus sp. TaxID=1968843 RepID=UPI0019CD94E7|nr:hypothetical protein [Rhizorhabdus sp.]MBD3762610.1 hypothetical protein [Rhizorhabdus sp.]